MLNNTCKYNEFLPILIEKTKKRKSTKCHFNT